VQQAGLHYEDYQDYQVAPSAKLNISQNRCTKKLLWMCCASTEFMERALLAVGELQQGVQDVKDASARLARHFCEDPDKFQLEECFRLFADFFRRTEVAHRVRLG
jgi:hypothetical protein